MVKLNKWTKCFSPSSLPVLFQSGCNQPPGSIGFIKIIWLKLVESEKMRGALKTAGSIKIDCTKIIRYHHHSCCHHRCHHHHHHLIQENGRLWDGEAIEKGKNGDGNHEQSLKYICQPNLCTYCHLYYSNNWLILVTISILYLSILIIHKILKTFNSNDEKRCSTMLCQCIKAFKQVDCYQYFHTSAMDCLNT